MESQKIKEWLRLSVNDMINDPQARRDLTKMLLSYSIEHMGKRSFEELEEDFANMLAFFSD